MNEHRIAIPKTVPPDLVQEFAYRDAAHIAVNNGETTPIWTIAAKNILPELIIAQCHLYLHVKLATGCDEFSIGDDINTAFGETIELLDRDDVIFGAALIDAICMSMMRETIDDMTYAMVNEALSDYDLDSMLTFNHLARCITALAMLKCHLSPYHFAPARLS